MQRGHIFKFRKAWFLKWYDIRLVNGQPKRVRCCKKLAPVNESYRSKADVRTLADKILAPINSGAIQPESSQRVADFIEHHYMPHAERTLRPSTVKGYRDIYHYHLRDRLGDVTLRDFRTVHGQRLLKSITSVGHTSLFRIKSLLSGVFTYAKREGILDGLNPMVGVEVPGRPTRQKQPIYGVGELDETLRALPEPARTIVAVAAFTGLRVSEIRGLQWGDFDGESIQVRRSMWRRHIGPTKTLESEASVPIIPVLQRALEAHRTRSSNPAPTAYIFSGERGASMNLSNLVRRVILPAIKGKELSDGPLKWKGWHAFRRGLASNLYALGVQPKVIQSILRHSNISTTMQIYVQTDQEASRAAMQKLEESFYPFGPDD